MENGSFIFDLLIKDGDFPVRYVKLPKPDALTAHKTQQGRVMKTNQNITQLGI